MNEYKIAILKKMKMKDIPKCLNKVFEYYKGDLLIPTKMDIGSGRWQKELPEAPQNVDVSNLDFERFSEFFDGYFAHVHLQFKSAYSMWVRVYGKEELRKNTGTKTIRVAMEANHALFDSETYSKEEIQRHWREIDEFGVLLAKAFDVDLVVGGTGLTSPEPNETLNYVCSKGDKYLDFLKKHIKVKFDLNLSKEKIKEIVKETAEYIEKKENYTLFSLRKLPADYPNREEITCGYEGEIVFYETLRKLKEETK